MSLCQTVVFHSVSVVAQMRFYVTTGSMFFYNVRIMAILAIVPFRVTYKLRAVIAVVGVTPWDY